MKIWWALCFISCIGNLNAGTINIADEVQEEKPGIGVFSHMDEKSDTEETLKDNKTDLSSFLKENTDKVIVDEEEVAKQEYFFVEEKAVSPTGGGLLLLNPNLINEPQPSYSEASWWENWWTGLISFFFEKST